MSSQVFEEVPLKKIKLSRNSRLHVDPTELEGLMQSILKTGLLQPIGLIKEGSGYEIAYGNRRFMAFSKLGFTKIPAIITESNNDFDFDIRNLTENVQRRQLSLAEVGRYIQLLKAEGLSHAETAVRLGVAKNYIENAIKSFQEIPEEFRKDIEVRLGGNNGPSEPGKISVRIASTLTSMRKKASMSGDDFKKVFKFVKSLEKPSIASAKAAFNAILAGENPETYVQQSRRQVVSFIISEDESNRLYKKLVDEGPFKTMNEGLIAILTGQSSERVKILRRTLAPEKED